MSHEATTDAIPAKLVQSQLVPISQLRPNKGQIPGVPGNPRLIRDDKYRKLKASIEDNPEMLSLREILLFEYNGEKVIIGGNMRYHALKELGVKETVCKIIPEGTTPEQLRAYIIKDNVGFGEWDYDLIANEWDITEVEKWGIEPPAQEEISEEVEAEEDNFDVDASITKNPKSKIGDLYQIGLHRLICGDSTDPKVIEALTNGATVDLFLTDPPYNVDYVGKTKDKLKKQNDKASDQNFQEFLCAAFRAAFSALKKGGAFYIWHADSEGYNFRKAAFESGMSIKQCLIWKKNSLVLGRQDYQWIHEPCLYGFKEGASHYFVNQRNLVTCIDIVENSDIESLSKAELKEILSKIKNELDTSIIEENRPSRSESHPTMKPVKLMGRLIKNSTRPGDAVLDTFGGSGTSMVASEQLGRRCYMAEIDPVYIDVIIARMEELTGGTAKFLGNIFDDKNEKANTE